MKFTQMKPYVVWRFILGFLALFLGTVIYALV